LFGLILGQAMNGLRSKRDTKALALRLVIRAGLERLKHLPSLGLVAVHLEVVFGLGCLLLFLFQAVSMGDLRAFLFLPCGCSFPVRDYCWPCGHLSFAPRGVLGFAELCIV
jgi:hypothetical protein